jgi:hypothetical protein
MAVQTSYSRYFNQRIPGVESDQARTYKREALNKSGADLDVGVAVVAESSADTAAKLPGSTTDALIGVVINDFGRNPNGLTTGAYAQNKMAPILCEGPISVQIDQSVTPRDSVYVRFAASGSGATGAIGSFRKDADSTGGTANVQTVTPTAVDSTIYVLRVEVGGKNFEFEFKSGTSTTATLIVTGFKAVMAADAEFAALVVASGTATLILTVQNTAGGMTVQSEGDGAMAVANTTPYVAPTATARKVKGARFLSTGTSASGVGEIYFSASAETP